MTFLRSRVSEFAGWDFKWGYTLNGFAFPINLCTIVTLELYKQTKKQTINHRPFFPPIPGRLLLHRYAPRRRHLHLPLPQAIPVLQLPLQPAGR